MRNQINKTKITAKTGVIGVNYKKDCDGARGRKRTFVGKSLVL